MGSIGAPAGMYWHRGQQAYLKRPARAPAAEVAHYTNVLARQKFNDIKNPDFGLLPPPVARKRVRHEYPAPIQMKRQRTAPQYGEIGQSVPWWKQGDIGKIGNIMIPAGLTYGAISYYNRKPAPRIDYVHIAKTKAPTKAKTKAPTVGQIVRNNTMKKLGVVNKQTIPKNVYIQGKNKTRKKPIYFKPPTARRKYPPRVNPPLSNMIRTTRRPTTAPPTTRKPTTIYQGYKPYIKQYVKKEFINYAKNNYPQQYVNYQTVNKLYKQGKKYNKYRKNKRYGED